MAGLSEERESRGHPQVVMWDGIKMVGYVHCGLPCLDHVCLARRWNTLLEEKEPEKESFRGKMNLEA